MDNGTEAKHTSEFIKMLFDEELAKILNDLPLEISETEKERYVEARLVSEEIILKEHFDPI